MLSRRCFVTTSASTGLAYVLKGLETGEAQTIAKSTRLMVGFPAGGSLDVVARCSPTPQDYAPSVVVDNGRERRAHRAGGLEGRRGRGRADAFSCDQMTLFPHVYQRLSYDPLRDFVR